MASGRLRFAGTCSEFIPSSCAEQEVIHRARCPAVAAVNNCPALPQKTPDFIGENELFTGSSLWEFGG
jgi:hypothetical protein